MSILGFGTRFLSAILGFRVKGFETPISHLGIGFSKVDFQILTAFCLHFGLFWLDFLKNLGVYIQKFSSHLAKYPKYFSKFSSTGVGSEFCNLLLNLACQFAGGRENESDGAITTRQFRLRIDVDHTRKQKCTSFT